MERFIQMIRRSVMYFSFQERKARELEHYKHEKRRLHSMEKDEIDLEYVNLKSEYEHKKNILLIFITSIVIAVLMSAWEMFFEFVGKSIQYVVLPYGDETEIAKVTLYICIVLVIFVTVILLWIIVAYVKKVRILYKKILMIEEMRKEPDNS